MKAYHFLKADMASGSGKEPAWKVGETRTYEGKLELCASGYHSSKLWHDALQYAPGETACIVEVSGKTLRETDKQVSQTRKLIDARDATIPLTLFACDCAERVLPLFEEEHPNDERPRKAIEITRLYLKGQATQKERTAARAAASDAASDVASDVASDAARAAAWAAEWAAAWAAARAAASDAASDAAWAAAWAAETKWQKRRLNKYMKELFNEA